MIKCLHSMEESLCNDYHKINHEKSLKNIIFLFLDTGYYYIVPK